MDHGKSDEWCLRCKNVRRRDVAHGPPRVGWVQSHVSSRAMGRSKPPAWQECLRSVGLKLVQLFSGGAAASVGGSPHQRVFPLPPFSKTYLKKISQAKVPKRTLPNESSQAKVSERELPSKSSRAKDHKRRISNEKTRTKVPKRKFASERSQAKDHN